MEIRFGLEPVVVAIILLAAFPETGFSSEPPGYAIYFELGVMGGGDRLARGADNSGYAGRGTSDIDAGAGLQYALGVRIDPGWEGLDGDLLLSLGYLDSKIDEDNGSASFDVTRISLVYVLPGKESFFSYGAGLDLHLNPSYRFDESPLASCSLSDCLTSELPAGTTDFDPALGILLQAEITAYFRGLKLGLRYSAIEYRGGGESFDAGGLGYYFSYTHWL
ncbi:MAG TPA: hypothetical protein VKB27_15760 [Gammaproteobacteria bacterium]|nr:hypothetical protein [Gammaproteobacteria bacterium]